MPSRASFSDDGIDLEMTYFKYGPNKSDIGFHAHVLRKKTGKNTFGKA
jgi:hypothetical protein